MTGADKTVGRFRSGRAYEKFKSAYEQAYDLWPTPWAEAEIETEFGQTHVHTYGEGPGAPAVLLHGANSNAVQWYPFLPALGTHRRVIALDTPGDPGMSRTTLPLHEPEQAAHWLTSVITGLGLPHVHLLGHSYGGWLVLNQAVHDTDQIISVTALDPPLQKVGARFIRLMLLNGLAGLAPAPVRRRLAVRLDNPVLTVDPLRKVLLTGARTFTTRRPAPSPLTDDELRSIKVPVTVIVGERSPLVTPDTAQERVALIPNSQVHVITGVGHGPGWEAGSSLPESINEFMTATE